MLREVAPESTWVRVGAWLVAPIYVAPVGIGEAEEIAKACDCELPSIDLVDEIWKAADLKVEPITMSPNKGLDAEQIEAHHRAYVSQLEGKTWRLLAGTHKDVVVHHGKVGLYGWHRTNGMPIQGKWWSNATKRIEIFTGHAKSWKDYSQGLRLCRRVA